MVFASLCKCVVNNSTAQKQTQQSNMNLHLTEQKEWLNGDEDDWEPDYIVINCWLLKVIHNLYYEINYEKS